jgi:hypothetical protein
MSFFNFYIFSWVATTQSYGDFPALLVEEDFWYLSVHYFRHQQAHETPHSISKLDSLFT